MRLLQYVSLQAFLSCLFMLIDTLDLSITLLLFCNNKILFTFVAFSSSAFFDILILIYMITDLLTPAGSFLVEFELRSEIYGQFTSISYWARFVYPTNVPPTRWIRIKPGYFKRLYRLSFLSNSAVQMHM